MGREERLGLGLRDGERRRAGGRVGGLVFWLGGLGGGGRRGDRLGGRARLMRKGAVMGWRERDCWIFGFSMISGLEGRR